VTPKKKLSDDEVAEILEKIDNVVPEKLAGPKLQYAINDKCLISLNDGTPQVGRVLAEFTVDTFPQTFYIIGFDDMYIPHFEVRDALLMMPVDSEGYVDDSSLPFFNQHSTLSKEGVAPRTNAPPSEYPDYDPDDN
jgi:hypothetical protein